MKKSMVRRISCNEQLYLDTQDLANQLSIQFVLEYEGIIDKCKLEDAISFVLASTNDSNVALVDGFWCRSDRKVEVGLVDIISENLFDDDFFKKKIDYKSHSLEVYLLRHYDRKYIVLRLLHSVSDGKGALLLLENIFRKLRNEELINCTNSKSEEDLVKDISFSDKKISLSAKYKFKSKVNIVKDYETSWSVVSIKGYHTGIIAKIASVLSKHFYNDKVNFLIPVDIRRHLDNHNYLGNMTLPIFLDVSCDDTWEEINGKLLYALKNKEELNKRSISYFGYKILPQVIRKSIISFIKKYFDKTGLYTTGAIISYLGKIDLGKFSNDEFKIVDFISLPLQQPSAPFSIVISEANDKMNIVISRYKEQISDEAFHKVLDDISEKFEYEIYERVNSKGREDVCDLLKGIIYQMKSDKLAVDNYTYMDLNNKVNGIMNLLYKNGVRQKDTVILYMSRSYEFVCCVIALMRMCAIFIPIDKSTNIKRVEDIIQDSKSKLIIFDDEDLDVHLPKININKYSDCNQGIDPMNAFLHNKDDIVYKIYTSGTTGKPKGIEISYNNLSNYLTWANGVYRLDERFIMPLFTSLSVDLTLTSIFLPLVTGGRIKIIPEQFSYDVLNKILSDNEINIIKATPSHLSLIDEDIDNNVKKIIVGGENFSQKLASNIKNHFRNNVEIYNEYGPTETTVGCVYSKYVGDDYENVPIGKCISNTKCYLIDDLDNIITSENTKGQLVIGGAGVSQGLINKKDDSLLEINNELFYKTGDLCFIKDNLLHCIGRINNQIKIRGNRVELDEINNALLAKEGVYNAYSVFWNGIITSFVCLNGQVDIGEIRDELERELPNYMVPSYVIKIDKLPIKTNGKVDLDALKNMIKETKSADVADVFDAIVHCSGKISDNESLETLGIDSLDTIKLIWLLGENVKINKSEFSDKLLNEITRMKIADIRNFVKRWCE